MNSDVPFIYPTMPQHYMFSPSTSDNFEIGCPQPPYVHLQQTPTIINDSLQRYFYMASHAYPQYETIARHPSIDHDVLLVHRSGFERNDCGSSNNKTNRALPMEKKAPLSFKGIMHNDDSYSSSVSNCTDTEQYSEENSVLSPSSEMTNEVNEQQKKTPQFN